MESMPSFEGQRTHLPNDQGADVPLFVRPQRSSLDLSINDGDWTARLKASEEREHEATARNIALELDLQAHARKRMDLEAELVGVHREHSQEIANKQVAYEELRAEFEKLQLMNLKLKEELLRSNRELMGVLAKKNVFKKEAERAARRAIADESRASRELNNQMDQSRGEFTLDRSFKDLDASLGPSRNGLDRSGRDLDSSSGPNRLGGLGGVTAGPGAGGSGLGGGGRGEVGAMGLGFKEEPRSMRSANALRDLRDFFDIG